MHTSKNYLSSWVALIQAISLLCWLLVCSKHTSRETHSDRSFHNTKSNKKGVCTWPFGWDSGRSWASPHCPVSETTEKKNGQMLDPPGWTQNICGVFAPDLRLTAWFDFMLSAETIPASLQLGLVSEMLTSDVWSCHWLTGGIGIKLEALETRT